MSENPTVVVRGKWMPCTACASIYVLVVLEHEGEILCYECIVDGYRYDPPEPGATAS